jgi:hypothetical protein
MKKGKYLIIILSLAFILSACNKNLRCEEEPYSFVENQIGGVLLRMAAFAEVRYFMRPAAGACYVFAKKAASPSAEWEVVFNIEHDDPLEVETKNIQIIDGEVVFAYMLDTFVISTNGGTSWDRWDPGEEFIDRSGIRHFTIDSVEINGTGHGTMSLRVPSTRTELKILRTLDFGRTWSE